MRCLFGYQQIEFVTNINCLQHLLPTSMKPNGQTRNQDFKLFLASWFWKYSSDFENILCKLIVRLHNFFNFILHSFQFRSQNPFCLFYKNWTFKRRLNRSHYAASKLNPVYQSLHTPKFWIFESGLVPKHFSKLGISWWDLPRFLSRHILAEDCNRRVLTFTYHWNYGETG